MSGVVQFIISILKLAILLAIMGDLTSATKIMLNHAAQAHQHGGISFAQMNRSLVGK